MKKLVKKMWGIGLVVVLLASLFIAAIPVSAGNYTVTNTSNLPSYLGGQIGPAAGFGIADVAQSGDTIWAVSGNSTGTNYIFKSANAGATWAKVTPVAGPTIDGSDDWTLVAVAPDDPSVVALVDTAAATDIVYLSTSGGAYWSALTGIASITSINAIAISPISSGYRYVAIGGNAGGTGYVEYWTQGPLVPGWLKPTGLPLVVDVDALAFSPNFLADQALLAVTENTTDIALNVYSYNQLAWDNSVDASFPRYLEKSTTENVSCQRADIVLDPSFYLGDAAMQVGFIGAAITGTTSSEMGGVYLTGAYATVGGSSMLSQPFSGVAINSVAWDGTNVMAAQYLTSAAAQVIWRSANALATTGVLFLQNSSVKTPGTGTLANVLFAGEAGYAFSRGNNSAIAKTTDLGKSFNGVALVNSNFYNILDFWISPNAAVTYAITDDGIDVNVWRKSAGVWQRVMILAAKTGETWLVRADAGNPDTVFLGRKGYKNMYFATDAGEHLWTVRSCSANIQDFAVQDKDIVYVATTTTSVVKTSNGAFTWAPAVTTGLAASSGGNCYSINLLADDQLLVGGQTGGVTYSSDGGATWVPFMYTNPFTSGNVLAAATGLAAGDTIFAASSVSNAVSSWKIGTNVTWTAGTAAAATGLAYNSGILYVYDNTANNTLRFLYPTIVVAVASDTIAMGATANYTQDNMINALQATTGSTTLWARNGAGSNDSIADVLDTYTEYFSTASNTPTPTYPINNAKIAVNSISGDVDTFVFQWSSPAAVSTTVYYNYNLQIYLDAAGLIPVGGDPYIGQLTAASPAAGLSAASGSFAGVPGQTYYWRVRVDAGAPLESYWSAMQSFTVEQLTAVVPVISSPENGKPVDSTSPAFSWSPISGATKYKFELSTNAAFVSTVYSTEVLTAGAMLPTTITLERGETYFWRVKAIAPSEGEWSTVANFMVNELPPAPTPPVVVQTTPAPVINIPAPPPAQQIVIPAAPAPPAEIAPAYIWAIIIIGAVLVIAVIVLIVRTRRSV